MTFELSLHNLVRDLPPGLGPAFLLGKFVAHAHYVLRVFNKDDGVAFSGSSSESFRASACILNSDCFNAPLV